MEAGRKALEELLGLPKIKPGMVFYLLAGLSSPVAAPLVSEFFIPRIDAWGSLAGTDYLEPGESKPVVEPHEETGILRAAFLSTESPKVRYYLRYEPMRGNRISWNYSAEELLFLGLDENTAVGPYVTKAESATNPFTGETVWVYSIYFPPMPYTAFYDGWVEGGVYNPTGGNVRVWLSHIERWVVKPEWVGLVRGLLA